MYLCISIERLLHTLSTRQAAAECIVRPALILHRGANVRRIMQIETDRQQQCDDMMLDTARYLISALRDTDGFLSQVWTCTILRSDHACQCNVQMRNGIRLFQESEAKNQGSITNKIGVYSLTQNTGFMSTINVYYTTSKCLHQKFLTGDLKNREIHFMFS